MSADWINIGFIRKPHGLKGYVRVEGLSDVPDRFETLDRIGVELRNGRRESLEIERCRQDGNSWLMKFLGVDSTENAERLRSAYIQVPEDAVAPLPEDAYYVFELEGCAVVSDEAGEAMIPAVRNIVVELSPEESRIVIRKIPGLIS